MSEEILEKLRICLKDENSVITFLKKISKSETLKNIREKCNKIKWKFSVLGNRWYS